MKAKKIVPMIISVVLCLVTISTSVASEWVVCSVSMAGPSGKSTYICLSDTAASPAFTEKWFIAPADRAKEMIAIALATMTNNMKVVIRADTPPYLDDFYLYNDQDTQQ